MTSPVPGPDRRRTPSPPGVGVRGLVGWLAVLGPRATSLARAYLPGAPLGPRHREHVAVALSAALRCSPLHQAHETWSALLGPAELSEVDDDIVAWAQVVVLGGPDGLDVAAPGDLTPEAVRELQALVAHTAAAAATLDALDGLVERARHRDRSDLASLPAQVAAALAAPLLAGPIVTAGAALALLGQAIPNPPSIEVDDDPNLLVQLLAETLPTWFGGAWGRTVVTALPVTVPVAVRAGLTGATVRVGRGRVAVTNGLDPQAWAVFDGEVDALISAGSHSLSRELRAARLTG